MKIRLANASDLEAMISLGRQMHQESRFAHYALNESKLRQLVLQLLEEPKINAILLAETERDGIVGMLAVSLIPLFFTDVFVAQDRWYYVAKNHRGSSAGLKLLMAFRKWAENRQAREMNINMSVDIDQAKFHKFMTHMNFKSCGSNFVLPLSIQQRTPA